MVIFPLAELAVNNCAEGCYRLSVLHASNASGMRSVTEAVHHGVVAHDWSNAKHLWMNAKPVNDQELLTKQAEMVLAADSGIKGDLQCGKLCRGEKKIKTSVK